MHSRRLAHDLVRERERVVVATLAERDRLRRDLHDGLGPSLSASPSDWRRPSTLSTATPGPPTTFSPGRGRKPTAPVREVRRVLDGLRPTASTSTGCSVPSGRRRPGSDSVGQAVRASSFGPTGCRRWLRRSRRLDSMRRRAADLGGRLEVRAVRPRGTTHGAEIVRGARGPRAAGRRVPEPRDRPAARHVGEDRAQPRLAGPGEARGARPDRCGPPREGRGSRLTGSPPGVGARGV
jgi:hypothetical protein